MSLRARLAVMFGVVGLVASLLVGLFAFRATSDELRATTDEFLVARAAEIFEGTRRSPSDRPSRRASVDLDVSFDADAITQLLLPTGDVLVDDVVLPITPDGGRPSPPRSA